jgi:hypothetical protein
MRHTLHKAPLPYTTLLYENTPCHSKQSHVRTSHAHVGQDTHQTTGEIFQALYLKQLRNYTQHAKQGADHM